MARRTPSAQCGRAEASARLKQALAFAAVADLVLGDESDLAAKDESHYGVHLVAEKNAHKLVAQAQALVALAQGVVQR